MLGRLVGMAVEGVGTWILLWVGGVPMAALLGILTGLLAFIPNIGAIISGVLLVLVGFSQSVETGLWALGVYFIVQTVDGYLIVPGWRGAPSISRRRRCWARSCCSARCSDYWD